MIRHQWLRLPLVALGALAMFTTACGNADNATTTARHHRLRVWWGIAGMA